METDVEKRLILTNWEFGEFFGRPGINAKVLQDGRSKEKKEFTTTSRRLMLKLKPILLKAGGASKDTVAVSILRTGERYDTLYEVKELPQSLKDYLDELGG